MEKLIFEESGKPENTAVYTPINTEIVSICSSNIHEFQVFTTSLERRLQNYRVNDNNIIVIIIYNK